MAKAIAWKSLKHAHGPATKVPAQIKQLLAAPTPLQRDTTCWMLWETLVGQSAWFEASGPAVALLLETAAKTEDPTLLLTLAADIIGGDQLRAWLAPPDAELAPAEKLVHEAAIEKKQVLFGALGAGEGRVRGAAAMVLAMLPELAAESRPALLAIAREDGDVIAQASAVLALGRLGAGNADATALIAASREPGRPAFTRGAAGMSWLRQGADRKLDEARAEIDEWLAFRPAAGVELPWFKGPVWFRSLPVPDAPARALCALGRHRGQGGIDALADFAVALGTSSGRGPVEVQLAKVLLGLGGFSVEIAPSVALASELTPEQQAMAKKLAVTHLLPAGGHRLPASGACRRRWIAVDPPGPLDQLVEHKGAKVPRWRAYQELQISPNDFPSRLDYWLSFIEVSAKSYPPFWRTLTPDDLEKQIAALPAGEELFASVPRVADDLAGRYAAAAREDMPIPLNPATSGMLLLPWVRAGKPIEPRWDPLVPVGPEPQCRELLAALPPERREAVLCEHLATITWAHADAAMHVLDLAPTRRVAQSIAHAIDEMAKQPSFEAAVQDLRKRLENVARQHPGLAP